MAHVSTYLNFPGKTEEAFTFYRSVFGTEFEAPIQYMRDIPPHPNNPPISKEQEGYVMHVSLPITAGHRLMGTDVLGAERNPLIMGTNISISIEPDTQQETERLFNALAQGGKIDMPLSKTFWNAYYGALTDQYGVQWMFNCPLNTK